MNPKAAERGAREAAFEAEYARLNDEQKKAVDAIDGPVFVIAGPGTGKTQVLTLRIANILKRTDTPPESILALTYTDAAAKNMRERLRAMIGSRAAKVRIHTFHSFAQSLINQYPDYFPRIIGAHVATDHERAEILEKAIRMAEVRHLRPLGDPLHYHYDLQQAIAKMKRENVTPAALRDRIKEAKETFEQDENKVHAKGQHAGKMKLAYVDQLRRIEKTEDLLCVYSAYEEELAAARRYDFEDLILEVVKALTEDEQFRLQVQESLLYILADEHQDANRAQNALLELISGFEERPNLFIVGDEKQAIYRFQGADLDNVRYFKEKYPDTTILTLVDNYRSTQSILDQALALISAAPPELGLSRATLLSHSKEPTKPLTLTVCKTADQELAQLAENIRQLLAEGMEPGEIAVLVRRNKDVALAAAALTRAGIPTTHAGDDDALTNRFVLALLRLLRAVAVPADEYLAGVLTLPGFPLSAADCARVAQFAKGEKRSILSVLNNTGALEAAKVADVEAAAELAGLLDELARNAVVERPAEVAKKALRKSGLLGRALLAPDRTESLAAIRGLLHAFEELSIREHDALLPRALRMIDVYRERNLRLPGHEGEDDSRVKVMTVHKAKGREFGYVFLPFLTTGSWSTRGHPQHFELPDVLSGSTEVEDERRVLYVGITRAKKHATLSYALANGEGRSLEPSELIEDLDPKLIEETEPDVPEDAWVEGLAQAQEENPKAQPSQDDLASLRDAFFSQGLSPTALNNYLKCPWKYFYVNLLRLPEVKGNSALYGTTVHAALKRYADERARGNDMSAEQLVSIFSDAAERLPLTQVEIADMQKKGKRALSAWWKERHEEWPEETHAEVPVTATLALTGVKGVEDGEVLTIRGTLDRMDEMGSAVNVIDYKTAKPKSRNEILGKTKKEDQDFYRQLTFYKLLLSRTEDDPRVMKVGTIDFVEPDEKGRIKSESFEITDGEVTELESLIRKSAEDILALSFWNQTCKEENCEWCSIRFAV